MGSGCSEGGDIKDCDLPKRFFKHECHMPGEVNYCHSPIDVNENSGYNEYKFTTTLVGLIYHAEMSAKNIYKTDKSYKTCGVWDATEKNVTQDSFKGGETANPTAYIIDFFNLLNCVGSITQDGRTSYVTYSKSTDDTYYASINTRQKEPFSYDTSVLQTDIFQTYVSMDSGNPKILAFNFAGVSSCYIRAVLIVNLSNHHFSIKYGEWWNTKCHTCCCWYWWL